jgi:hypothetical protein
MPATISYEVIEVYRGVDIVRSNLSRAISVLIQGQRRRYFPGGERFVMAAARRHIDRSLE